MKLKLIIAFGQNKRTMEITKVDHGTFRIEGRDRIVIISTRQFHGWAKKEWVLTHGQMSQESVSLIGKAIEESRYFRNTFNYRSFYFL